MTAEGVFPKIAGDIAYASEANTMVSTSLVNAIYAESPNAKKYSTQSNMIGSTNFSSAGYPDFSSNTSYTGTVYPLDSINTDWASGVSVGTMAVSIGNGSLTFTVNSAVGIYNGTGSVITLDNIFLKSGGIIRIQTGSILAGNDAAGNTYGISYYIGDSVILSHGGTAPFSITSGLIDLMRIGSTSFLSRYMYSDGTLSTWSGVQNNMGNGRFSILGTIDGDGSPRQVSARILSINCISGIVPSEFTISGIAPLNFTNEGCLTSALAYFGGNGIYNSGTTIRLSFDGTNYINVSKAEVANITNTGSDLRLNYIHSGTYGAGDYYSIIGSMGVAGL